MIEYDADEIAEKYVNSPTQLLHEMVSSYIIEYFIEHKKQLKENPEHGSRFDFMIDVGCGNGKSTRPFAPYFRSVVGCDISKEQIKMARQTQTSANVSYKVAKGESIPAANASADLITSCFAVQDMHLEQFFKECKRVIKPSGIIAMYGAGVKQILLEDYHLNAPNKSMSAIDVYMSSYLNLMFKYFKDNDIPEWHIVDKYKNIHATEESFTEFRRDDLEFPLCQTLTEFIQSLDYVPAWKKFNERFEGITERLERDIKKFWNVSDLDSGSINLKIVKDIFLLIFHS